MFNVSVEIDGREDILKIYRLHEISAAAICAVSPSLKISTCRQRDRLLSAAALKEFAKSKVRGDPNPSSFEKETIGDFEFEYARLGRSFPGVRPAARAEGPTGVPSPPGFPRVPPAREITAHRFDAGMSLNLGWVRDREGREEGGGAMRAMRKVSTDS